MVPFDSQTGTALRTHAHSSNCLSGLGIDHRTLQPAQQRLCLIKMQAERAGIDHLEHVEFGPRLSVI